jgi:hypothetical protein
MKKLMSIFSMLLLALTATTLVSCDDDSDIAATLEGTWQGKMELEKKIPGPVLSSHILGDLLLAGSIFLFFWNGVLDRLLPELSLAQ